MIEYPPQASLPLIVPGWKCLLLGKLIESCSQIITQNVQHITKQCVWSDTLHFLSEFLCYCKTIITLCPVVS